MKAHASYSDTKYPLNKNGIHWFKLEVLEPGTLQIEVPKFRYFFKIKKVIREFNKVKPACMYVVLKLT